ncbi:hypothetical protein THAOC_25229, partial [Thalassiosira oceanica]
MRAANPPSQTTRPTTHARWPTADWPLAHIAHINPHKTSGKEFEGRRMPQDAGGRPRPAAPRPQGGGRPTDGRLPPKKTARAKVKYRPPDDDRPTPGSPPGDEDAMTRPADAASADGDVDGGGEHAVDEEAEADEEPDDPLLLELRHLRTRIRNVQSSIQTSRGLANPAT